MLIAPSQSSLAMRVSKRIQEASNPIAVGNDLRVCEFQVRKTDSPVGELAMQPVPVIMFTTAHPSCRFLHICDTQGLLKHA